jgi:hypothetical protein
MSLENSNELEHLIGKLTNEKNTLTAIPPSQLWKNDLVSFIAVYRKTIKKNSN